MLSGRRWGPRRPPTLHVPPDTTRAAVRAATTPCIRRCRRRATSRVSSSKSVPAERRMDGAEGGRKEETRGYGIMTGDVVRPILHVVATYAHRVSDSWRMMRKGSRLGSPCFVYDA